MLGSTLNHSYTLFLTGRVSPASSELTDMASFLWESSFSVFGGWTHSQAARLSSIYMSFWGFELWSLCLYSKPVNHLPGPWVYDFKLINIIALKKRNT